MCVSSSHCVWRAPFLHLEWNLIPEQSKKQREEKLSEIILLFIFRLNDCFVSIICFKLGALQNFFLAQKVYISRTVIATENKNSPKYAQKVMKRNTRREYVNFILKSFSFGNFLISFIPVQILLFYLPIACTVLLNRELRL